MKDKKALILYILLTVVIWQLCVSLTKIISSSDFYINGGLISISKTTNNGAAFGVFNDNPHLLGIIGIFVIAAVFICVLKSLTTKDKAAILLSSIFTSGIIGNTTERLFNGYVFDFIKINLFNFPIFNLFDILITVSVFLYILFYIKNSFLKRKNDWF